MLELFSFGDTGWGDQILLGAGMTVAVAVLSFLCGVVVGMIGAGAKLSNSTALRGAAASDLPDPRALRRLQVPTLVLAWRGDPTHPLSTAKRLVELLPDAELHVAAASDDIRDWSERIREFLANAVTTPPASRPRA